MDVLRGWTYGDTKHDLVVQVIDKSDNTGPDFNNVDVVTFRAKRTGVAAVELTGAVHDVATFKLRWRPEADESDYGAVAGKIAGADHELEVYVHWTDGREKTYKGIYWKVEPKV